MNKNVIKDNEYLTTTPTTLCKNYDTSSLHNPIFDQPTTNGILKHETSISVNPASYFGNISAMTNNKFLACDTLPHNELIASVINPYYTESACNGLTSICNHASVYPLKKEHLTLATGTLYENYNTSNSLKSTDFNSVITDRALRDGISILEHPAYYLESVSTMSTDKLLTHGVSLPCNDCITSITNSLHNDDVFNSMVTTHQHNTITASTFNTEGILGTTQSLYTHKLWDTENHTINSSAQLLRSLSCNTDSSESGYYLLNDHKNFATGYIYNPFDISANIHGSIASSITATSFYLTNSEKIHDYQHSISGTTLGLIGKNQDQNPYLLETTANATKIFDYCSEQLLPRSNHQLCFSEQQLSSSSIYTTSHKYAEKSPEKEKICALNSEIEELKTENKKIRVEISELKNKLTAMVYTKPIHTEKEQHPRKTKTHTAEKTSNLNSTTNPKRNKFLKTKPKRNSDIHKVIAGAISKSLNSIDGEKLEIILNPKKSIGTEIQICKALINEKKKYICLIYNKTTKNWHVVFRVNTGKNSWSVVTKKAKKQDIPENLSNKKLLFFLAQKFGCYYILDKKDVWEYIEKNKSKFGIISRITKWETDNPKIAYYPDPQDKDSQKTFTKKRLENVFNELMDKELSKKVSRVFPK